MKITVFESIVFNTILKIFCENSNPDYDQIDRLLHLVADDETMHEEKIKLRAYSSIWQYSR